MKELSKVFTNTEMTSRTVPATIDVIGEDLLQSIVARLPATSFASAACVSRSWNVVCDRVLCRPKLASACSFNHSLQAAVEEVVNKVLSEPIRPHFAIASVGGSDEREDCLEEAHHLISAALGFQVPVVTNCPNGIIGRDACSDEFNEIEWYFNGENDAIMLVVGFLPGLKVTTIPLLKQIEEPKTLMMDEFVTDIREFSTSVSSCNSPAAIIIFGNYYSRMKAAVEKLDYAMSPDTVIVGDTLSQFRCSNNAEVDNLAAVALVFVVDRNKNKPPGIGETQFHVLLSSGLSPVGPTYKAASVIEEDSLTWIASRREGSHENIDGETVLNQVYDEIGDQNRCHDICIGLTKTRNFSIGQEKVGCMTYLAFHGVCGHKQEYFFIPGGGVKTGDTFRFYHSDPTTALSSAAAVSSYLRSFNEGSNKTTGSDKQVFGGLIFTSPDIFSTQQEIYSSPFLDNFPGVTLGGTFCGSVVGRRVLTTYVEESQEQKTVRCCLHNYCSVYLILSYSS